MTIQDVTIRLGISWNLVKEIKRWYLERRYNRQKLNLLELLTIDEISIGKHHRYSTVLLVPSTSVVVFVGDGRGALVPFWQWLRRSRTRIRVVTVECLLPISRQPPKICAIPQLSSIISISSKCLTTNSLTTL